MRFFITAAALALASLVAVPAFADGNDKGAGGKHFPMPAAEFKAKVDKRMAKARERMEEKAKTLPANEATDLRAKFNATAAQVNAEVAKAVADGTVTKDEAKAVRKVAPHGHGKHGKHARHGKGGKAKK